MARSELLQQRARAGRGQISIFTVLDQIFCRLCAWALTSCFLISIVEVKVQQWHRGGRISVVYVLDYRACLTSCECIHHLDSRKIPCENISISKLRIKTKLTDSLFSQQHTHTTSKKFPPVFNFLNNDDVDNTTIISVNSSVI